MSTQITEIKIGALQFKEIQTGGGCTALEHTHANGFIWITELDEPNSPYTMQSPTCIGFYNNDGDEAREYLNDLTLQELVDEPLKLTAHI